MSTHRFILEPYKGVSTRHTCPNCHRQRCFSKYIDTEKQIWFPDYVGRCDHEQKCGYHFTPRDYFEQNPSEKEKFAENSFGSYTPIKEVKPIAISYMDLDIVNQSLRGYLANKLFQFLSVQFGETETFKLMKRYKVGTSKYWDGATVFWQTDNQNKVRTGKIMLYNSETGKRVKEPYNHVTWVHSVLHKGDYNLKQCFFGEHLLSEDKSRPVALVESEKTAIIASYYLPQFLWIASGGKFRIDDHRQPQIFPNQVHLLVILRHTHAGNGLFRAQPLADQAAENIHFVIGCCRDEQGGFVCSGFQLGFRRCPVALDAHNVQCILALSQVGFITVYHGDVVSLLHQQGSQIAADLAVPNNYDFHS